MKINEWCMLYLPDKFPRIKYAIVFFQEHKKKYIRDSLRLNNEKPKKDESQIAFDQIDETFFLQKISSLMGKGYNSKGGKNMPIYHDSDITL